MPLMHPKSYPIMPGSPHADYAKYLIRKASNPNNYKH